MIGVFMNPLDQAEIISRIEAKVRQLGEAKLELEARLTKMQDETASLYRINKELLQQLEVLGEKNRELELTRSSQPVQEDFKQATKQRINELVKEIDECLALLNK